jgi:hypothetical protein
MGLHTTLFGVASRGHLRVDGSYRAVGVRFTEYKSVCGNCAKYTHSCGRRPKKLDFSRNALDMGSGSFQEGGMD